MIKDYSNSREVTLGNGTVGLVVSTIDGNKNAYVMYQKDFTPIGTTTNEHAGKKNRELKEKSVLLRFEGKNAIKSINIMLEDLQEIKAELLKSEKKTLKECFLNWANKVYEKLKGE